MSAPIPSKSRVIMEILPYADNGDRFKYKIEAISSDDEPCLWLKQGDSMICFDTPTEYNAVIDAIHRAFRAVGRA